MVDEFLATLSLQSEKSAAFLANIIRGDQPSFFLQESGLPQVSPQTAALLQIYSQSSPKQYGL